MESLIDLWTRALNRAADGVRVTANGTLSLLSSASLERCEARVLAALNTWTIN